MATLSVVPLASFLSAPADAVLVVGRKPMVVDSALSLASRFSGINSQLLSTLVSDASDGDTVSCPFLQGDAVSKFSVGVVSSKASRHNCPERPDEVTKLVKGLIPKGAGKRFAILAACDEEYSLAVAGAIARAFPSFHLKEDTSKEDISVEISFTNGVDVTRASNLINNVRDASRIVDMPCSEFSINQYRDYAASIANTLGVKYSEIVGDELISLGYGGIHAVGRASTNPPALIELVYEGTGESSKTVVLVGKGIVFDQGGLQIKPDTAMLGMKRDMAGSSGMLHAFRTLVENKYPHRLVCLLCCAENAISSSSFRPDDILRMKSGKTVEINHTDAEGRLVLADGVYHAVEFHKPDLICVMATLTGAQGVATGERHAAIISNDELVEQAAIRAGKLSGDLTHPLIYCPEFFMSEFQSEIADMKNSVKSRTNASSSCAGQFIVAHIQDYIDNGGRWLHIDMAYPSFSGERATGYGVCLLSSMLMEDQFS